MKWTITFFSLINFRAENYVMLQWTCLTRYNQRNWNLFFSLEFIVHFITLIAYPPFNGLLSIYSVASFCQLVSLFLVFLLFFLLSIVFCHRRRRFFFSPKNSGIFMLLIYLAALGSHLSVYCRLIFIVVLVFITGWTKFQ